MKIKQSTLCLVLVILGMPAVLTFAQEIPVTTSSKEAKKLFLLGRDKVENSEAILAAELLGKALALDPNFAMAYLYKSQSGGSATIARENREKAVSLISKVSEGEKYSILLVQANVDGNQDKRKEYIDQLLRLYPKDKRVHMWNGFYQNSIQKFDDAIISYSKAIEIDKNYGPALNLLGYAYMRTKNWNESEKYFKRYAEVLPNSPNPVDSYAEMLMKSGRFDEAITNFKKAIEISPAFINSYTGMGTSYIFKGDFVKARECYKLQLERAPSYNWKVTAQINSVISYLHEGLIDEALKQYTEIQSYAQSEKQQQGGINSLATMGWINLENKNVMEAAKNFGQARILTENADLTDASRENNRLSRKIERFHLLLRVMEFDAAESLLTECKNIIDQRKSPNDLGAYYTNMGMLERGRENYDKALEAFSKSNPDDPYAWYQKALTFEKKGDRESAVKVYGEIVNWNWYGGIAYALIRNKAKQKMSMSLGSVK